MINVFALNNVRDQKKLNKFEIYRKVLRKCHHRIRTISNKGESFCWYIVPEYIYGVPKYDTLNCAAYIVNKLKRNGFKVIYTYPNLVFVSWEHIPSEIKHPEIKNLEIKLLANKMKNNTIEYPKYRYIDDYQPSKNFLSKLNTNNFKRIEY